MRNLLFAMILGSICMIGSQIMEILTGPSVPSTAINMSAFIFFTIGIWGIHQQQTQQEKNKLSLLGTLLLTIGGLAFVALSIQIMQALPEKQPIEFVETPVFMIAGICIGLGTILFGLSVMRINYFPKWAGILLLLIPWVNISTEVVLKTAEIRYFLNIVLGATFINISAYSLKRIRYKLQFENTASAILLS